MSISREDLEQGRVDLSAVIDLNGRVAPPLHPGTVLRTEFLDPLGLSVAALARAIGVPRPRLNDIVLGRRSISADTALRLARHFGMSPQFWMQLQNAYDLEIARATAWSVIIQQVQPRAA